MNVFFSIIVPVYKTEKYLRHCISSLLQQTFQDFEILLINDGSPDNSGKICDEYAKNDPRIRVYHTLNQGASAARNFALDNSYGEFVLFVDSDDRIARNTLEACARTIIEKDLDLLQFSLKRVNIETPLPNVITHSGCFTDVLSTEDYIQENKYLVCAGGSCLKRSVIEENQLRFPENLRLAEDQVFMMSAMICSKRLQRIDGVFYYYTLNPESVTQQRSKTSEIIETYKTLYHFIKKHPVFIRRLNLIAANTAVKLLLNGDTNQLQIQKIAKTGFAKYDKQLNGLEKIFYFLSIFNYSLACRSIRVIFQITHGR